MNDQELVVCFHCDACGKDVKYVDTDPNEEVELYCAYCGNQGKKSKKAGNFYPYDDYYLYSKKNKKI